VGKIRRSVDISQEKLLKNPFRKIGENVDMTYMIA
jgi:hypothetical protein